jgi:hypothetical protein
MDGGESGATRAFSVQIGAQVYARLSQFDDHKTPYSIFCRTVERAEARVACYKM